MYSWYTEKLENGKQKGKTYAFPGSSIGPRGQ